MGSGRILNVEDYAPSRYLRTRVLTEAGYQVVEANTAASALEKLRENKVSLVLLDMNLPDGTGADICRLMRSDATLAPIPVVIVSATARGELDRLDGVRSGANMYLTEPVPPAVLVSTISQLLASPTRLG